jgi:hypothetical protein
LNAEVEAALAPISALVAGAGIDTAGLRVDAFTGGGNNRVFTVHAGRRKLLAKRYFRHAADPRDRLGTEFRFLEYAQACGIDCIPAPVAFDDRAGIGLYEFIEGRRLPAESIEGRHVDAAAAFFLALNRAPRPAQAGQLPDASEACFSLAGHLAMVDARIARLASIDSDTATAQDARRFAATLEHAWRGTRSQLLSGAAAAGIASPGEALPTALRCLSPSDFGFHNALSRPDGTLCFLDFEYAGWDDPAKMIGDFFAHPAVPVAREHYERFVERTLSFAAAPADVAALAARARLLEPLFRIKWCCIMLNEFLPASAQRRRFADPGTDPEDARRAQLAKAARHLDTLTLTFED